MRKHDGIEGIIKSRKCPGIHGTRDTFGIGKEFWDPKTMQWIDTNKKWERAGFRNALDMPDDKRTPGYKNLLKEKIKKQRRKRG